MRTVTEAKLGHVLTGLPGLPRVVTSGNFATPWRACPCSAEGTRRRTTKSPGRSARAFLGRSVRRVDPPPGDAGGDDAHVVLLDSARPRLDIALAGGRPLSVGVHMVS
jgi:hypothetical protein